MMYVCKRRVEFSYYFYISSDVPACMHTLMNYDDEPYFRAKETKVYLSGNRGLLSAPPLLSLLS